MTADYPPVSAARKYQMDFYIPRHLGDDRGRTCSADYCTLLASDDRPSWRKTTTPLFEKKIYGLMTNFDIINLFK